MRRAAYAPAAIAAILVAARVVSLAGGEPAVRPLEAAGVVGQPAAWGAPATFPISSCSAECSCVPPSDLVAARDAAEFVFRGRIQNAYIYTRDGARVVYAAVVVSEVFKGPHEPFVEVDTPAESAECGAAFGLWSEQLIFARRLTTASGSLIWVTDVCMGTRPYAAEEAAVLGAGWVPDEPPAHPCGRCAPYEWDHEFDNSTTVFVGELTAVEDLGPLGMWEKAARFHVRRVWKGPLWWRADVLISYRAWSQCEPVGWPEVGKEYLVFGDTREITGETVVANSCHRMMEIDGDAPPPAAGGVAVWVHAYVPAVGGATR